MARRQSLFLLAIIIIVLPAAAPKPARLEGIPYARARTIILGYGWKPLPGYCEGGGTSDSICGQFPEIGNCSGTGVGFCDMTFIRNERCLTLVTVGGAPAIGEESEPVIRDVEFSRGPCSKDPNKGSPIWK